MFKGGIRDHIGGGFHRYSTDKKWHIPHFEKMLYDNAQLPISYLTAYQISKQPIFENATRDILHYISTKMIAPGGGFYSAEDADSLLKHGSKEHAEGAFYVWEKSELDKILGDRSPIFCYHYAVQENGNAELDPHSEFTGKNILMEIHDISESAKKFGLSQNDAESQLAECRKVLYELREKRPRPFLDDKIITAWNGLMISAFVRASVILKDREYAQIALNAANFIKKELYKDKKIN